MNFFLQEQINSLAQRNKMTESSDFLVWGNNQWGLLSKSTSKCLSTPMPLCLPYDIISVCASEKHISFVTKNGQLYSYGSNMDGRLGISSKSIENVSFLQPVRVQVNGKVLRAESGFSHMCVLTDRMQLYAWGLGDYGALGTGQFKSRSTATPVNLPKQIIIKLRQISCGAMHTAFLTQEGDVYACGSNQYGELGVNKPQKVSTPIPISFHLPVQQVSCGVFYTLLLTREGRVFGMGNNKYGQLGLGHKINQCHPTLIRQLNDIVKVTAGYHSGAIDKFGNLYIWGSGSFGQLLKPKKFVLSVPVRDVAIRGFFGIAIGHTSKNQNRIYCWGNNTFGELGLGNYEASKEPQQVEVLRGLEINKVALGVNFAIVLLYNQYDLRKDRYESERFPEQIRYNQDQYQFSNAAVSQRSSIKGFEEKYLNTNRKKHQDTYSANVSNKQFPSDRSRNIYRTKQPVNLAEAFSERDFRDQFESRNISQNKQRFRNIEKSIYSPLPSHQMKKNEKLSRRHPEEEYYSQQNTQRKDYEQLFLDLSQDYQILVKRYKQLENQISIGKFADKQSVQILKQREKQLLTENLALKDQITKLTYELVVAKDEIRIRNNTLPFVSPNSGLSAQIQEQYNKLLTQKEQLITRLNLSISKTDQQYQITLKRLGEENNSLKTQLATEVQKNRRIIDQNQALIPELEREIKKSSELINLLREENESLKTQNIQLVAKNSHLEEVQNKNREIQANQIVIKEKYEQNVKDSQTRTEMMSQRLAQLEVQLKYQRDFNRKYQQSIVEIKKDNEKLRHEINLQTDRNLQKEGKIENLKGELQKYKKMKKELDEKNIQLEQFMQSFQTYKKKTKQMLDEKQREKSSLDENTQRLAKQFQDRLLKKDDDLEDLAKENSRLQKQINKLKQSIISLKTQITLKDDQLQHLTQQRAGMEKKVNMLTSEINKQIEEREKMVREAGEIKREITKIKMHNTDLQSKLDLEIQQKSNFQKANQDKDKEISQLREELRKANERNENLSKENEMYRQQIEEIGYQLENQTKINEELANANRQFADTESDLTRKISQLENRIYELEDENKSYTPRYEALMIRNRQLDQRNRELSEMINKAIQIQAESYKNNILKEVQINTDNIINQIKEEQEFQSKNRRSKNISKEVAKSNEEQEISLTKRGEQSSSIVPRQEPYSKMMKERISQHKKKVSESAQKLANILQLNQNEKSAFNGFETQKNRFEDYQKINSKMESFSNQKEQFMSKIHSFAQKLKII